MQTERHYLRSMENLKTNDKTNHVDGMKKKIEGFHSLYFFPPTVPI